MSLTEFDAGRAVNPVDMVEQIAAYNDWIFERSADDEITISLVGLAGGYELSLSWMEDLETLHLAGILDLSVPQDRADDTVQLLAQINTQLWIGHFDYWKDEGLLLFRLGSMFAGGVDPNPLQCQALIDAALAACERYHEAFQLVCSGYSSPSEALRVALFETVGEA